MNIKSCPACGADASCSKGETPEYLLFKCPSHGSFEIHERFAKHLLIPSNKPQMDHLSKTIFEARKSQPNGVVIVRCEPIVRAVER